MVPHALRTYPIEGNWRLRSKPFAFAREPDCRPRGSMTTQPSGLGNVKRTTVVRSSASSSGSLVLATSSMNLRAPSAGERSLAWSEMSMGMMLRSSYATGLFSSVSSTAYRPRPSTEVP